MNFCILAHHTLTRTPGWAHTDFDNAICMWDLFAAYWDVVLYLWDLRRRGVLVD